MAEKETAGGTAVAEKEEPKTRAIVMTDPRTGQDIKRGDFIKDVFENGMVLGEGDSAVTIPAGNRGKLTKWLDQNGFPGIKFQTVFQSTKGMTSASNGGRAGTMLEVDGKKISRTEWIKEQFRAGKSRRAVQDQLKADFGIEIPYGSLYQISMKLKDVEGITIAKNPVREKSTKAGGDEGEEEGEGDPDAPAFEEEELEEAEAGAEGADEGDDDDSVVP
jgi:hypothetical protein